MTPKDILAVCTAADEQSVFNLADVLSRRWQAHIGMLHLAHLPEAIGGEVYVAANIWAKLIDDFRAASAADLKRIKTRIPQTRAEARQVEVVAATAGASVAREAVHVDLTIMQRPASALAHEAFEGALFSSGRPVLLVPPDWAGEAIGKRIMVAWKAGRESARAVADAAPFLKEADDVVVVTVDAKPAVDEPRPGEAITKHLARHGVKVELRNADGLGRPAEEALLEQALGIGADLIVMGGYGQSRLREFIFGGVTRALTRTSPIALLLSH